MLRRVSLTCTFTMA
ncbi:hypothetical protein RDI58_004349 [Solanum bulbocastanum]|uniref:Uncharacterized protein n=1 Tax=Solanum bulbocastanum TaxID=147425 RepID=A0AAN8YPW2_SOLBU